MDSTYTIIAILVAVAFGDAHGQIGIPCHKDLLLITPRHNLNISEYMGTWYKHEIAGSHIGNFPEPDYECATQTLGLPNATDITRINSIDELVNSTTGGSLVQTSEIEVNNTRSPFTAVWSVTTGAQESDAIVLFTDLEFNEWSVVYQCTILPDTYRYETVTAMTRSRSISPDLRRYLKALMVGFGFRIGDHHPINQQGCKD